MPIDHPVGREPTPLPEDLLLDIADTFGMLADATRAQIVYLLTKREYSVNELAENVPVSASAVSHHLARLRAVRLVQTRREGNQVFYSIDDAHVEALFREALYHLDHVRRNLPDHPRAADVVGVPNHEKGSDHDQ
jgi:ArsR family transcriptional regulator, lead/cadmium/zinc/bismuth-responsive transcriptional repressor